MDVIDQEDKSNELDDGIDIDGESPVVKLSDDTVTTNTDEQLTPQEDQSESEDDRDWYVVHCYSG